MKDLRVKFFFFSINFIDRNLILEKKNLRNKKYEYVI